MSRVGAPLALRGSHDSPSGSLQRMCRLAQDALDARMIEPFYQPRVSLLSGHIVGFEALLRWRDRTGALRYPGEIRAAFDIPHLSVQLGQRMQQLVFADMRRWREEGVVYGRMAINASAAEFGRDGFADEVLAGLDRATLSPQTFGIEVTETVFLGRGAEYVETAMRILSEAGAEISLDDFGTGYASLSHLKQFPVDSIKIDRSFVKDLTDDPQDAAILQAVLQLGKGLKISITAEGIETEAQAAYLRTHGCDCGQGFLFGRPVAASHVPHFLAGWRPKELVRSLGTRTRDELWATIGNLLDLQPRPRLF